MNSIVLQTYVRNLKLNQTNHPNEKVLCVTITSAMAFSNCNCIEQACPAHGVHQTHTVRRISLAHINLTKNCVNKRDCECWCFVTLLTKNVLFIQICELQFSASFMCVYVSAPPFSLYRFSFSLVALFAMVAFVVHQHQIHHGSA